ncbi:signal peptide peptidase SppA [Neptunicella marina]|uniref:Signal peptide peptidase SppA n=1 Tax=Neptunicella marina TaxID=2125989 RepID=A0A8J6IRL7_9ALTE|nr:signal peptide peptidase SppA [Neptunicella marina]MBC3764321.1 signal peptide peptidase SppA [Neptunicella marina]
MASGNSWTKALFVGIWNVLNFIRSAFFNIIFIVIVIFIISAAFSGDDKITVPVKSALVLNIKGNVVIQKEAVDPLQTFVEDATGHKDTPNEELLDDIIFAINNAKEDQRIKTLVLDLENMRGAGLDKLEQIAAAIDDFKQSGKPVFAIADNYSQGQYYLAAHADHLYLNPMGTVLFEGFGRYGMYFKSALEKLKANAHIFRVGTFKSAVEPFIRDDMSDAAKEANNAWLSAMWQQYKESVANARNVDISNFDEKADVLLAKLEEANGDFAQYALNNQWVDALKTRQQVVNDISDIVGKSDSKRGYTNIDLDDYLDVIRSPFPSKSKTDNVAIVVAKGEILDGSKQPGTIGGDSTARLLRKARLDDSVKAVVLYVDSPGGSAFASEVIRQEIESLKAAGKPVVAQMSSVAASGGYWISASADEIWAAPSTITGSIGIFGMFLTFENSLEHIGIHTDGIATTELAGISQYRALDPKVGAIFQRSIENGYDKFISMVAENRHMTKEQVDQIAQGRVWIGEAAKDLGLVDHLGYINDAIASAAKLAGLEKYDTKTIEKELSPQQKFMQKLFGKASAIVKSDISSEPNALVKLLNSVLGDIKPVTELNDPNGIYARCLACEI